MKKTKENFALTIHLDHDLVQGFVIYDPNRVSRDDALGIGQHYFQRGFKMVVHQPSAAIADAVYDWSWK